MRNQILMWWLVLFDFQFFSFSSKIFFCWPYSKEECRQYPLDKYTKTRSRTMQSFCWKIFAFCTLDFANFLGETSILPCVCFQLQAPQQCALLEMFILTDLYIITIWEFSMGARDVNNIWVPEIIFFSKRYYNRFFLLL